MKSFDQFLAAMLDEGAREADKDGSATIEAQHLLLAIAGADEPATREVLAGAGLDYTAVRAALDREFEHSLAAAGVSLSAFDLPAPGGTAAGERRPQPGESVKLALERGLGSAARKADLRPAHVLLGILSAQVGTVPRALALAGIDRAALTDRVREALTGGRHG